MKPQLKMILLFGIVFLFSEIAIAQVQEAWVARYRYSNKSYADHPNSVKVDSDGNVYVTGTTNFSTGDLDENEDGIITIKYNKNGERIWAARFGGVNLKGTGIAVDANGNVYVVGRKDWDTSPSASPLDFVTLKYNSSGVLQWSRSYKGPDEASFSAYIGIDNSANIYITGASLGEEDETISGLQGADYATIKYNNSGIQQWVKRYNGSAPAQFDDRPSGLSVDGSGNVYVTGKSQKDGRISCTTIKYSTDGVEQWIQRYNKSGSSTDIGKAIILDAMGNVYITSQTFEGNIIDVNTLKYNTNGVLQWVSHYGSPSNQIDIPGSIGVDVNGNVFVTGLTDLNVQSQANYNLFMLKYNDQGIQQWVREYALNLNYYDFYSDDQSEDHFANLVVGNDNNVYVGTTIRVSGSNYNFLTLRYDSDGTLIWGKQYTSTGDTRDVVRSLAIDHLNNVYVTGASITGSNNISEFTTIKYTQCDLLCPSNITISNDPGQCGAIVNYSLPTSTGDCGTQFNQSPARGSFFPVGITTVTGTSVETGATCTFTITVTDTENPVISCPADKTVNTDPGVCYASAVSVNAGTATAIDNCNVAVVGVRSDGLSLTDNYPVGVTTITWTATDASNNTDNCTQTITVEDNEAPVISNTSVSKSVLAPPNHKMVDVFVYYTVTDNCSASASLSVTSNEPEAGLNNGDKSPDWIIINNNQVQLRAERDGKGDGRIYTITITATDVSGNTSTATQNVIVAHNIGSPHSGTAVKIGSTVIFSGSFWDITGNTHTAKWTLDDKISFSGKVTEPSGFRNGTVTGSYKLSTAGVYKIKMNITDQKGVTTVTNTNGDLQATVVVYDPNGGYTFGGGYFVSPAGALHKNPSATGDASFGFSINYYKSATNPKGETQFDFKVGELEFNALNFEYLAISGARAQFKGTGKITGDQSGYGFIMTVIDGDLDGSGIDKIRMKIFNRNTGLVIYDTQAGMSDAADPVIPVGDLSNVTISNNTPALTTVPIDVITETSANSKITLAPNPSNTYFNLSISNSSGQRSIMQVFDVSGRLIESRFIASNQIVSFGNTYRPGYYYVSIVSGTENQTFKILKLKN